MADKKQNGLIVIKVFKRAQEQQSESLSQLCTISVYAVKSRGQGGGLWWPAGLLSKMAAQKGLQQIIRPILYQIIAMVIKDTGSSMSDWHGLIYWHCQYMSWERLRLETLDLPYAAMFKCDVPWLYLQMYTQSKGVSCSSNIAYHMCDWLQISCI